MDFFSAKTDAVVTPAKINFFALYDPSLSHNEEDSERQLLLYLPDRADNTNTKVRNIGMIQGIHQFCSEYTRGEPLDWVGLDGGYVIFTSFEQRYNAILSIQLTKVKDEGQIEYKKVDIAPVAYLKEVMNRGYDQFRLHNGTIQSLMDSMSLQECISFLHKWWSVWFTQLGLSISEDGALKMLHSFRRSQLRCDSETYSQVCGLQETHKFKDMFIWNDNYDEPENFGLVYEHSKLLLPDSKMRFLQWLEEVAFYGLSSESLSLSNIVKIEEAEIVEPTEQVYDPFKLVLNTLSDVSHATGIPQGVETGYKAMAHGVEFMNHYMPWGSYQPPTEPHVESMDEFFLIGSAGEGITYKNVYLEFDQDEKLHRLVIFKSFNHLIILVYEFNINTLNDVSYYFTLSQDLSNLMRLNNPTSQTTHKSFYYILLDKSKNQLETNIPMIPLLESDEDTQDHKYFYDLSLSRTQPLIIHRELISSQYESERLVRTKNGWWCYHTGNSHRECVILKKWKVFKGERGGMLENSADITGTIGVDAKKFVDTYMKT
jgi:hypothetical protein